MSQLKKLSYILNHTQKIQVIILTLLLIIGIIFEMLSLGIILPALSLILDSNIAQKYSFLSFLENFNRLQILSIGMSILIVIYVLKSLFMIFLGWKQNKFTLNLTHDISNRLFKGYLTQPYMFHIYTNSAVLLRNIQTEVGNFNAASQSLINLLTEFSVIIAMAVMLFIIEPLGTTVVIVFFSFCAIIFHQFTKLRLLSWGEKRQIHQVHYNKHLFQGLGAVKDIKLMGREKTFCDDFQSESFEISNIQLKVATVSTIPRYYLELLAVIGLALLSLLMVSQQKQVTILLPTLGIFVAAAFRMIPSINRIMISLQQIRVNRASVNVLYDELTKLQILEFEYPINETSPIDFCNVLTVNNIEFSYPTSNKKVLNGVSLKVKKGESVGFIGPSGSGKSTLVDLILGLLTPNSGDILIDGIDLKINIRNWQNQIGYVPQSIYLTDDSIRKNVAFGIPDNQIDDAAVTSALKDAQLLEFVQKLDDKSETFVGERGVRLSGGQRQRIGIARAIYHNPKVIVLDEATSALDNQTEFDVMNCVNALKKTKTLIIIAHRLSTLENCDRIYELSNGEIINCIVKEKHIE